MINSKITCDKLTDDQLEIIGEYYMEQMMPGESHKRAHEMMGLTEGSEYEEQFHINLAIRSYCEENIGMMGRNRWYGMMGNYPNYYDSSYNYFNVTSILINILLILLIIVIIIWLVKLLKKKGGRKLK